ncbi:MAG: undecaprenyl/decaprenyl-phosphate alpha-N-acetylglucosaminyl 1-phosphate transferase [Bacteroidetes bacterium]|nr:undecaprenyl/decaprenyl-phosphate alpha-N-acetylglucosaminyl 1-phosphate transferase [Bacteroidota bacterium]
MNYYLLFPIFFIASLSLSCAGYSLLLRNKIFSFLKKKNYNAERWASQTKPIFGGVIFYIIFLFSLVFTCCIFKESCFTTSFLVLFLCSTIAFFAGLFDDIRNTSPFHKFLFQCLCAIILIISNMHIQTSDNIFINYALTFFWVVGIMNSINMLDNMDAISGSVSAIICLAMAFLAFVSGNIIDTTILLAVVASLVAYLFWNWHPSKIYMGDSGSQFLGIILAIFSIQYIWNYSGSFVGFNYREVVLIGAVFIMPLCDTTTVFINRIAARKSPFTGDTNHTTHNFVYCGFSERWTAVFFIVLTSIGCFLAIYGIVAQPESNFFIRLAIGEISMFAILFSISRLVKKHKLKKIQS